MNLLPRSLEEAAERAVRTSLWKPGYAWVETLLALGWAAWLRGWWAR